MKVKKKWPFVLAAALLAGAGIGTAANNAAQEAMETVRAMNVESEVAARGDIAKTVTGTGNLAKVNTEEVVARVGLTAEEVFVKEGDPVEEGTPIVSFTKRSIQEELLEVRKSIDARKKAIDELDKEDANYDLEKTVAEGELDDLRVSRKELEDLLKDPVLRADVTGVVETVNVKAGEAVTKGSFSSSGGQASSELDMSAAISSAFANMSAGVSGGAGPVISTEGFRAGSAAADGASACAEGFKAGGGAMSAGMSGGAGPAISTEGFRAEGVSMPGEAVTLVSAEEPETAAAGSEGTAARDSLWQAAAIAAAESEGTAAWDSLWQAAAIAAAESEGTAARDSLWQAAAIAAAESEGTAAWDTLWQAAAPAADDPENEDILLFPQDSASGIDIGDGAALSALCALTVPVTGALPQTAIDIEDQTAIVSPAEVAWMPAVDGSFAAETVYTAVITLKAAEDHYFYSSKAGGDIKVELPGASNTIWSFGDIKGIGQYGSVAVAAAYPATAAAGTEPTVSPSPADEPTVSPSPTDEPTVSPSPADEPTVSPSPADEPTVSPSPADEPTVSPSPSDEPTVSPSPTEEAEASPSPTDKPTPTPWSFPTFTPPSTTPGGATPTPWTWPDLDPSVTPSPGGTTPTPAVPGNLTPEQLQLLTTYLRNLTPEQREALLKSLTENGDINLDDLDLEDSDLQPVIEALSSDSLTKLLQTLTGSSSSDISSMIGALASQSGGGTSGLDMSALTGGGTSGLDISALTGGASGVDMSALMGGSSGVDLSALTGAGSGVDLASLTGGASSVDLMGSGSYSADYTAAVTVLPGSLAILTINVDELDINRLSLGQSAVVTLDALEGQEFEGIITKIADSAASSTGSARFAVELALVKTPDMKYGMSASAVITVGESRETVLISMDALQSENGRSCVYTSLDEKGEPADLVPVETGLSNGTRVEILSGISAGDTVYYKSNASSGFPYMGGLEESEDEA